MRRVRTYVSISPQTFTAKTRRTQHGSRGAEGQRSWGKAPLPPRSLAPLQVFFAPLRCAFPWAALTAVALLCLWSAPVLAHKVNIFAYVEGDSVYTESYFNDGRKAVGSKVVVYDKAGTQLLEGTTDEEGLFAFKIPKMEDLKIVLQASMGHRNEYELSRSELGGKEATPESPEAAGTAVGTSVRAEGGTVIQIDMDRIAQLIDRSLERRLAPVVAAMTRIQRAQEKPGFRDVIGGIGYLVGLAGLAMYLRGRKNP